MFRPLEVRVKIEPVPKCLNGRDDSGPKLAPGYNLEVTGQGPEGRAAKITQEAPLVFEEGSEHLGDHKDHLTVGDIQEERLPHPLAPLLQPLGVAGGAEAAGAAGEHQEPLLGTVRTTDAGKPAARVAALEVALDHLLDDRSKKAVLFLETALIVRQEAVKIVKEHPVQDGAFRISRTIHSGHDGRMASRNGPVP